MRVLPWQAWLRQRLLRGARKLPGGTRLGNLYFSSGLTGVRPEARKDPLAFGGDIKEQTHNILKAHKKNLEEIGSSLENVLKVNGIPRPT